MRIMYRYTASFKIYSFIMQVPVFIVDINSLLFLVIYRITKIFLGCFLLIM